MASNQPHTRFRIKDEELLTNDDLLLGDYVGSWIRTRAYEKSHRLAPDHETGVCGAPIAVSEEYWERFRRWAKRFSGGRDPGEWFMAVDTRKGGRCAGCKSDEYVRYYQPNPVAVAYDEKSNIQSITRSPAEMRAYMQFMARVARVARELGAEIQ